MFDSDEPLWDRTLRRIRLIWPLGDSAALKKSVDPSLPESDLQKLRQKINRCLEGRGGEVSARTRAAELGEAYLILNSEGRKRFLELLAGEYDIDNKEFEEKINQRLGCSDQNECRALNFQLRNLLVSPRTKLLRQFNELQEGVKFLVDLRAELLPLAKNNPELTALDQDIHRLLCSWFDVGFLDLQRITWNTPAALLEKLIEYESVHAIQSWRDMKHRLRADRRCYAYFHPRMPHEPLIFVEVALVNGISSAVHDLLNEENPAIDPHKADTAIFYSISNCQKGLAGVSFGNFLIKHVVKDLSNKLTNLKTFSTLSPIPGFVYYLENFSDEWDFTEKEKKLLGEKSAKQDLKDHFIKKITAMMPNQPTVAADPIQPILLRLCARYLLTAQKGAQAFDRVSHFHLSNGARIERINWAADLSAKGIAQSGGIMVNYLYNLATIEKNHENYTSSGERTASSAVSRLAKL